MNRCRSCRTLWVALLSVLLGGSAGFAVLAYGGSRDASMVATFVAAMVPILVSSRHNREQTKDKR